MRDLTELQSQIGSWAKMEFGENISKDTNHVSYGHPLGSILPAMGMMGELGELIQLMLRAFQGRPKLTPSQEYKAKADALCDLLVFMCDYASREEINLHVMFNQVWDEVSQRRQATWEADKAKEWPTLKEAIKEVLEQDGHGFGHSPDAPK
jgi:NTP pyrophosphatase (non-canonical NTP hydrolase)